MLFFYSSLRALILRFRNKLNDKGSFIHMLSWTISGTSLGFLVQIIFSPIISRIFGPEAYAEFAIYNLLVTNLISIATFSYPQALIINKNPKNYFNLSLLIFLITSLSVLLFFIIYFSFAGYWNSIFGLNVEIVVFVGIAAILAIIGEILSKWNLITNKLKRNTIVSISTSSLSKLYTIGFGNFIKPSGFGLISSEIFKLIMVVPVVCTASTINK